MFTETQLAQAVRCPEARAALWLPHLQRSMSRNGITTRQRAAHYLAQLGHESQGLSRAAENLNYSAANLLEVFGDYFNRDTAREFARQPERIANRVYANRMGNGDAQSGDGWRYRGRGPIQLTGRRNYAWASEQLGEDLLGAPDRVLEPAIGAEVAAAFWRCNGLNPLADAGDVLAISRRINLGTTKTKRMPHGLADRMDRTNRAKLALGVA